MGGFLRRFAGLGTDCASVDVLIAASGIDGGDGDLLAPSPSLESPRQLGYQPRPPDPLRDPVPPAPLHDLRKRGAAGCASIVNLLSTSLSSSFSASVSVLTKRRGSLQRHVGGIQGRGDNLAAVLASPRPRTGDAAILPAQPPRYHRFHVRNEDDGTAAGQRSVAQLHGYGEG